MAIRPLHVRGMLIAGMAVFLVAALWSCTGRQQEPVKLEAEIHGSSSQLVIYWQRPIPYTVDRSGQYLFVRFSRPVRGDSTFARRTLSSHLSEFYFTDEGRVLVMHTRGRPDFRHFAVGNALVLAWTDTRQPTTSDATRADLDLPGAPQRANAHRPRPRPTGPATGALRTLSPESGTQEKAAPRTTPAPRSKARPDEKAPAGAKGPASEKPAEAKPPEQRKSADEVEPSPDEKKPGDAKPPGEREPGNEAKPTEPPETKPSEEAKTPESTAPHEEDDTVPPRGIGWNFMVSGEKHETRIMVDWPAPTATAVFRHAGRIWIIFDRPAALGDLAAFQRQLVPGVERLSRIEHGKFTILVADVQADVRARVRQKRNSWTIFLKSDGDAEAEQTAKLGARRGTAEQVTISLPGAESPLRLTHPDVPGTLHIIPSRSTIAVAVDWRFGTFQLVPAVQGAVIEEIAGGVVVEVDAETVVIRRDSGQMLSPD